LAVKPPPRPSSGGRPSRQSVVHISASAPAPPADSSGSSKYVASRRSHHV
jgi:hypothetical protein